jgi:hypothetical protein
VTRVIANGVQAELPEGWEDRTMVTLVGPRGARGFAANIVITREPIGGAAGVADYARRQLAAMKAELPRLEVLDEREVAHRGAPAFARLQRFEAGDDVVQQAQTFVLSGATVYVITCSAQRDDFDAHIPAFRQITESFRVGDDAV